ncbi:MAG: hypothetical protein Q9M43_10755 [Sulfurimonas sp.]|nr:hypothetical protein [Sulfurimonas sp.]
MITTIKKQGNGYLVDNSMSIPNDPSNRHYKEVQEALVGGTEIYPTAIVLEDEFTTEELAKQAQDTINSEALASSY